MAIEMMAYGYIRVGMAIERVIYGAERDMTYLRWGYIGWMCNREDRAWDGINQS